MFKPELIIGRVIVKMLDGEVTAHDCDLIAISNNILRIERATEDGPLNLMWALSHVKAFEFQMREGYK